MKVSRDDAGDKLLQRLDRLGPLQRQQRLLAHMVDDDFVGQRVAKHLDVAMLGRAVDDDVEILAAAGRHQIVDDAAAGVHQQRIAELAVGEHLHVARQHVSSARSAPSPWISSWPMWLTSNRPGILAGPQMLGHDAFVLDGHLIAGELDHPGALRAVPGVERERLGRLGRRRGRRLRDRRDKVRRAPDFGRSDRCGLLGSLDTLRDSWPGSPLRARCLARPRLSLRLRALPLRRPALGRSSERALSRLSGRAVLLPERFRGRLLLRRRPSCLKKLDRTLPRGLPAASLPETGRALASPGSRSQRRLKGDLARGVVAKLVLRQLEADQVLERGAGDRIADRRIAQADRSPHPGRRPGGAGSGPSARSREGSRPSARTRTVPCAGGDCARRLPAGKFSATPATCLATMLVARLHRRRRNRAGRPGGRCAASRRVATT